jgi:lauroyl/myristoyl acyltransferase
MKKIIFFVRALSEKCALWIYFFPFRFVITHLPLAWTFALATLASRIIYPLTPGKRNIIAEETRILYGKRFHKDKVKTVVKKSYDIYFKRIFENLMFGAFSKEQWERFITIEGLDILDSALERGKGVILLLGHFGSFLLPLPVLGYRGYTVCQLAGGPLLDKGAMHKTLFQLRQKQTKKMPFRFIQTDQYLGPVVRALKQNHIIVIAFDGRTAKQWVQIPFFNRIAQFSPGPFKLAMRTGATILPTFVVREEQGNKQKVIFEPAMELATSDNEEDALRQNTIHYAKIFERYLLKHPCHFGWILYTNRDEVQKGLNVPFFVDSAFQKAEGDKR